MKEANNWKELPLEELIGSLMTYEMKISRQEKEMQEEEGKKEKYCTQSSRRESR